MQEQEIIGIINSLSHDAFRPVLYVIPFALVADIVEIVPVAERAYPLSVEYFSFR